MTEYSTQSALPQFIERAKAQTLTLALYRAGSQVAITSGTVDVVKADDTLAIDAQAVSIDSNGAATYSLLAADTATTDDFSTLWRVEWTLVISGETITYRQDAHLIRVAPHFVLGESDLLRRHSDLANVYPDGRASWQHAIDEAREVIYGRLIGDRRYPYLIISPWSLREPAQALALANVARELSSYTNGRGRWADLANLYDERFEQLWGSLNFEYDADQDGASDGREQSSAMITLTAGPTSGSGGF